MGNELVRPGDPQSPCIAILSQTTSELTLLNLEDGSSSRVKISDTSSLGIVTIGGEVYAVTQKNILKIHSNGKKKTLRKLKDVNYWSIVVTFQKKIYVIQPRDESMLCFDPANNSFDDNLPGCGLGPGFCASASDDFIYAMGDAGSEYLAKKFDASGNTWFEIPPMNQKRSHAAAAILGGKIYVMGSYGALDGSDASVASVEYYDPGNNTWTEISNMNKGRSFFSVCVIGNQLYAVGGNAILIKKGHRENSIEVYSEDQWVMLATKFEHEDISLFACTWPHGSLKSDFAPGDQPEVIEEENNELQAGRVSKTTEIKGRIGDQIDLPGVTITILKEDVGGDEITVIARVHTKREAGFADIAPRIEFDPPVNFAKPVSMRMKTCLSAHVGEKILASLFTRDHPEDEWKEKEELSLRERNEVEFEIQRCSGIKVAAKNLEGNFHLISDFYIHSKTKRIVAVFTRDRVAHDLMEKDLLARNFFSLAVGPHEVVGNLGNEISLTMKCKKPKECKISDEVLPSASFTVNEKFIVKSAHSVYYELEPEPTDECGRIEILYGCTVDGELDHSFPMTTELPLTDIKTEIRRDGNIIQNTFSNCLVNSTANQVAFGGGTNMSGAKNISADVSTTEVNAPVGQLATGNANITEQGTGNNYVAENIKHKGPKTINALKMADNGATFTTNEYDTRNKLTVQTPSGDTSTEEPSRSDSQTLKKKSDASQLDEDSQENMDRSVAAGKAIYDESTSSSVGENITVHRSGK